MMDGNRGNYMVYPALPMTYEELLLLVPPGVQHPDDKRHKAVYGLIQAVARQLEDARRVSKISPSQYLTRYQEGEDQVQIQFRITGIQQEMGAINFRLGIRDYLGTVEKVILENRMLELYEMAKNIDPAGVSRYERMIDKRMRKASG